MAVLHDTFSFILNLMFHFSYSADAVPQEKHFAYWIPVPKALGLATSKSIRAGHVSRLDHMFPSVTLLLHMVAVAGASPRPLLPMPSLLPLAAARSSWTQLALHLSTRESPGDVLPIHGMNCSFLGFRSLRPCLSSTPPFSGALGAVTPAAARRLSLSLCTLLFLPTCLYPATIKPDHQQSCSDPLSYWEVAPPFHHLQVF